MLPIISSQTGELLIEKSNPQYIVPDTLEFAFSGGLNVEASAPCQFSGMNLEME